MSKLAWLYDLQTNERLHHSTQWPVSKWSMCTSADSVPDSKVHGANMGPIWAWQYPDGPHVGPMSLAIWGGSKKYILPSNPLQLPNRTIIAVLTVKFQNDWTTEKYVMGKRDFARFDLKLGFGGIF